MSTPEGSAPYQEPTLFCTCICAHCGREIPLDDAHIMFERNNPDFFDFVCPDDLKIYRYEHPKARKVKP